MVAALVVVDVVLASLLQARLLLLLHYLVFDSLSVFLLGFAIQPRHALFQLN